MINKYFVFLILCSTFLFSCKDDVMCKSNQVKFLLQLNLNDTLDAKRTLDSISVCSNLDGMSSFLISQDYLLIGESLKCREWAFRAMEKDSSQIEGGLRCIFESYRQQKTLDSSLYYFQKYLEVEKSNFITDSCSVYYMKGEISYLCENYHLAYEYFSKAIKLYPKNGNTLSSLMNIHVYQSSIIAELFGEEAADLYARNYLP